jgi:hypothetical protein
MNELTEQIMFFNGTAFGDTQKFPTIISAPSFELSNDIGNDRFVKAKFTFTTKAYLINENASNRPTIQKLIPPNKIVVNFHESDTLIDTFRFGTKKTGTSVSGGGSRKVTYSNISKEVAAYLAANNTNVGTYVSSNSAIFTGVSLLVPPDGSGLPNPTVNDITFFINGQYVPSSIIILNVVGNDITATFDTTLLGYTLEADDEIIGSGKWS